MGKKIFDLSGIISIDGLDAAVKGLKELGTQFEQAEKAFFKFGRQIEKAGSKLSSSITVPIVAAAGAATLAAKSFGDFADGILDMSNASGLSTDTIQELKQVASDTGTEFESFVDTIFKITKNMPALLQGSGEASNTLRKLGVNVFETNGNFRDSDELFTEIIKKLQNIPGPMDRAAAAQTIFGKGAAALSDVLSMTNAEFDASRQKAHDLGLVMSGDGLKAADDFRVALNDATAQLVAMGRAALLDLLPLFKDTLFPLFRDSIIPALKDMAEKVAGIARWFNALDEGTKRTTLGLIAFVAAIGPALIIGGKMIGAVAGIATGIKTIQLAFVTFSAFMATNPLGIALIGIGLLTTAIIGVVTALDKIKKKKAELAADKTYSASADEERRDNEENIRLWQQRLDWLERQRKPTQVMIEEMEDLRMAISATNEVLGKSSGGGVPIRDAAAEAAAEAAAKAAAAEAKRTQDEIARINSEYQKKLFDNTIMGDEERYQAERTLALQYVAKIGGDVALAAEAMDREHQNKLIEQTNERLEKEKKAKDKAAEEERDRKDKEADDFKKLMDDQLSMRQRFIDVLAQIGGGIAGIFQQSTANKMAALDNQQTAERQAIENSIMGEKEKRKKLHDLDVKQDKARRDLQRKAASESKKIAIFDSIIGTASAVVNALGAQPWGPWNFVYSGIVGALGAIKTGFIAAQPLPLAKGATVRGGRGGIMAEIGEAGHDEIVMPVESGIQRIVRGLRDTFREQFASTIPLPFAMAGGGGGGGAIHYHVGTLIADDYGLKEMERRQLALRNSEAQRKGQI